jgi:hypothetical protein
MSARTLSRMHCVVRWILRGSICIRTDSKSRRTRVELGQRASPLDFGAVRCLNDGHNNIIMGEPIMTKLSVLGLAVPRYWPRRLTHCSGRNRMRGLPRQPLY